MSMKKYVPYALSGAAAGLVNGFFGAGGGMILVPLLVHAAKMDDKRAFSSSVCIIFPLCLVSIAVYASKGMLPLRESLPYLLGGTIGGIAAGLLFQKISARFLHLALGILILFGGVRLLLC